MSTSDRWGLYDEIQFVARIFRRKGADGIVRYLSALNRRFVSFCGGAMQRSHRAALIRYCKVVVRCAPDKFIHTHLEGGRCKDATCPYKDV